LGKAQMMGIRRAAAADEARLLGNRLDVFPIANPTGRRQSQHGLVNNSRPPPPHFCSMRPMFLVLVRNGCLTAGQSADASADPHSEITL